MQGTGPEDPSVPVDPSVDPAHDDVWADALVVLPDGTVKQRSPLTGTVVWTVPGRANRPLPALTEPPSGPCAFCPERYADTPPEKARVVVGPDARVLRHVAAEDLTDTVAEFRRIPNLFEILSVDYWRMNHGYEIPQEIEARAAAYTSTPQGREHVLAILRRRHGEAATLDRAVDLFAGTHDVVVARRHTNDDGELAGSGVLSPQTHRQYVGFTVDTMRDLYAAQPHARYVVAFQNWLRPAGASFDHLHKQLVAIDEHGPRIDRVLARVQREPQVFNSLVRHAVEHRLIVAQNGGAVAVAGVGHRYPSLEVYSTSEHSFPWEHTEEEVAAFSDLLHGVHAATGTGVPTNEEWHHRPMDASAPMPWHAVLKWRVSTLAGFEGGTKIYVNTLDPVSLRERVVAELLRLRDAGALAPMSIGDECVTPARALRYGS